MTMSVGTMKETVRDRVSPALEAVDANVRDVRKAVAHGRRAAEDFIDETTLQVRRHPLSSIALAATGGALAGCLLGFVLGWQVSGGRSDAQ